MPKEGVLKGAELRLMIMVLIFAIVAGPALATTILPRTMRKMVAESGAIVRATVLSVESRWNSAGSNIETDVYLSISATYKGQASGHIRVTVPGGRVDDLIAHVVGAPRFSIGEDVVVFLAPSKAGAFRVLNLGLGKYEVATDAKGQGWVSNPQYSIGGLLPKRAAELDPSGRMALGAFDAELLRAVGQNKGESR